MSSSSYQSGDSSQDTTPYAITLRTVHSNSSLDDAYSAECILDIPNPKKQDSYSEHPFEFDQFRSIDQEKQAYNPKQLFSHAKLLTTKNQPCPSLSETTFDQIEHLTTLAKHSSLIQNPIALDHIDDLADLTTRLAIDVLEAQVSLQSIQKAYENDNTLVRSNVLALRTSRTKLEAERAHVQDLATRMAGIKFDHMTALAKYQVQKAEYEYRAKEAMKLERKYKDVLQELDATKEEREKELIMMATQMWSLKLMVGEMFARSEWTLRDGMARAGEEIDFTLQRLDKVMNDSIESGKWGKKYLDLNADATALDNEDISSWVLVTLDGQDCGSKFQTRDPELLAWDDMEQYMAVYGSCTIDDEKTNPEVMVLNSEDMEVMEDPYWHEGEYRFWDY